MSISDPHAVGAVRRVALAAAQNGGRAVAHPLARTELRGMASFPSYGAVAGAIGAGQSPEGVFLFLLVGAPLADVDSRDNADLFVCARARLEINMRLNPGKTLMAGEMLFAALAADPDLRAEMAQLQASPDPRAALAELADVLRRGVDQ